MCSAIWLSGKTNKHQSRKSVNIIPFCRSVRRGIKKERNPLRIQSSSSDSFSRTFTTYDILYDDQDVSALVREINCFQGTIMLVPFRYHPFRSGKNNPLKACGGDSSLLPPEAQRGAGAFAGESPWVQEAPLLGRCEQTQCASLLRGGSSLCSMWPQESWGTLTHEEQACPIHCTDS